LRERTRAVASPRSRWFGPPERESLDLETIEVEGLRHYVSPDGRAYPSVTTVIGSSPVFDQGWRERWAERVGQEEVDLRTGVGRSRGTALHAVAERFLLDDPSYMDGAMPSARAAFGQLRPLLEARIGRLFTVEARLYSHRLRTGGRNDLWCEWDGVSAVPDFKSSRYSKREDDILGYFVQTTAYSLMIEEIYGVRVPRIVVLLSPDYGPPQEIVRDAADFYSMVDRVFITERGSP
jgi:genome maintenance exonuclease 1